MHHIFFQGGLGAGKTFGMSMLAHYLKEQVERQGGKIDLYSNYDLKAATEMLHYTDWYKVAESQGSICCWDEAHMAFSNRKWSKHSQEIATQVMMYTRKMQSVQMYCSPSINNVDSRIRQIVEVLVTMRKVKRGFKFYFYDFQTNEHIRTVFFPEWKAKRVFKLNLYDTHNMVRSFPLPSTEKQSEEFFDRLEEIHDKARGKITHGAAETIQPGQPELSKA